ncbi:hypothetical protein [Haloarchaeobius sp. HME9146]|uniref:hypothetical protein n=1 Tax=Haloarchaeobius sp. HME9146 TaxID=2978732 RepID=UPI0021C12C21|nr:hypothetical protein [Haloarchaeobius sp. HME9146]MCT9095291.1 hypothetical protein [Haloarchaeobius sp. HME9146]
MMTELVFHFIRPATVTEVSQEGSVEYRTTDEGMELQMLPNGDIRVRIEINSLRHINLSNTFSEIKDKIRSSDHSINEYSVALLLKSENPVSEYIQHETKIEKFSSALFNNPSPRYRELGENRVKISFSQQAQTTI